LNNHTRLLSIATVAALCCGGCDLYGTDETSLAQVVEPGERLPGGETTNTRMLGVNSFLRPADNLSLENQTAFYGGNGFFNQAWVVSPSSTTSRDGLGPLFNARSCSSCHFKDGKGKPPEDGKVPFEGLLLRLAVEIDGALSPHPVYGGQLQDGSSENVPSEGTPVISWSEKTGHYPDGVSYSLLTPSYTIDAPQYGPLGDGLRISPRIAPHMIGLGLLEAIPEARLMELADPNDENGDGISGEIQRGMDGLVGRFGWKADMPTVDAQVGAALIGDMGLTSEMHPKDTCTPVQTECLSAPDGGEFEVSPKIFDRTAHYSRAIAVPVRRDVGNPTVLRGKGLFRAIGCDGCHTPNHTTGKSVLAELENQLIWPYTDLLLHDMGEGLADGFPIGNASGSEWKTPPLWGVGLMEAVTGHTRFLHDGRARNLEEAILWHGGEATEAKVAFMELNATDRGALLSFVGDL